MSRWNLIKAFVTTMAWMLLQGISVRSMLSPVLFFGLWLVYEQHPGTSGAFCTGRIPVPSRPADERPLAVCAALFSGLTLLADWPAIESAFESMLFRLLSCAIIAAGMFLLGLQILRLTAALAASAQTTAAGTSSKSRSDAAGLACLVFVICMLCYLPWFLYSYPGIMSPDGTWQLEQALGYRPWSNHHPAAHTAVIWLFYHLGRLFTDNTNQAVAVYTFAQMTFLAFSCAFAAGTLRRIGMSRRFCLLVTAFYALVPFNCVFGIIVSKDTPFACAGLLLTCILLRMLASKSEPLTLGIQAGFVVVSILFCLFRTNGWYAYWLLVPVMLVCLRGIRRRVIALCVIAVLSAFLVRGPLLNSLGVIQPDFIESCCVPLQQISRVVVDGKPITPEEQALIGEVVDYQYIDDIYSPGFADSMKELVRAGNQSYLTEHKKEFFSLWLSLGRRYPGEYVRAWADLTLGYWYPNVECDTASIEGIWENMTDVYPQPLLRGFVFVKVRELLLRLGDFVPLYGLFWGSGTYTWLLMTVVALILARRRGLRYLAVAAPSAGVLITLLIAAPLSTSFRYTYMITLAMPVWLAMAFYIPEASSGKLSSTANSADHIPEAVSAANSGNATTDRR